jgi:hypothetical protein
MNPAPVFLAALGGRDRRALSSVRQGGRNDQAKWMRPVRLSDMPGASPDPSLGGPRYEDPTDHLHGKPCPDGRPRRSSRIVRQSLGVRDIPDPWQHPTSSRAIRKSRGGHVHRSVPLLLGVGMEYQISYRPFLATSELFFRESSGAENQPRPPRPCDRRCVIHRRLRRARIRIRAVARFRGLRVTWTPVSATEPGAAPTTTDAGTAPSRRGAPGWPP